jgi:hypothetical protein
MRKPKSIDSSANADTGNLGTRYGVAREAERSTVYRWKIREQISRMK